jgi:hypothetical protein
MDLSQHIKTILELMTCPDHQEHPNIQVVDGSLSSTCCCEKFQEMIEEKINDLIVEHLHKER